MPKITDHQSYLEGRAYPSFDPKQEELARALVILHDYLGTEVVVSDLDCTETSDHTIGITGKEKLATKDPDVIFASQAIRMLFPLLKNKLGVINYTMTLQNQKVADEVINLGYVKGVFEDVIASGKYERNARDEQGNLIFDAAGENIVRLTSDEMKQHKVLEISRDKNISLDHFAFLSDADIHLTAYMKEQGAFVFGGDGTDEELVEVKIFGEKPNQFAAKKFKGALTNIDGSEVAGLSYDQSRQAWIELDGQEVMGLTSNRLKQMGVKLISEIARKGIEIPDEVYNAVAPIFGMASRKVPKGLSAGLPFTETGEGVYGVAGEATEPRPGFSVDGRTKAEEDLYSIVGGGLMTPSQIKERKAAAAKDKGDNGFSRAVDEDPYETVPGIEGEEVQGDKPSSLGDAGDSFVIVNGFKVPMEKGEDKFGGQKKDSQAASAAANPKVAEQPLLEQLKELLKKTLPSGNQDENSKVNSTNPKEGFQRFLGVFGAGRVNENKFVFDVPLTISADEGTAPIFHGDKVTPIQTKFNAANALRIKGGKNVQVVAISELSFEQRGENLTALTIKTLQPKAKVTYRAGMSEDSDIAKMVKEIVSRVQGDELQIERSVKKTGGKGSARSGGVDETGKTSQGVAEVYEAGSDPAGDTKLIMGGGTTFFNPAYRSSVSSPTSPAQEEYDVGSGGVTSAQLELLRQGTGLNGKYGGAAVTMELKSLPAPQNPDSLDLDGSSDSDSLLLDDLDLDKLNSNPTNINDLFTEPNQLISIASRLRDYCQMFNTVFGFNEVDKKFSPVGIENLGETYDVGKDKNGLPLYQVCSLEHGDETYYTVTVCIEGRPVGLRYEIPIGGEFTLTKTENHLANYDFLDKKYHKKVEANDRATLTQLVDILDALTKDPRIASIGETETDTPAAVAAARSHSPLDPAAEAARNGGGGRGGSSNARSNLERKQKVGKTFIVKSNDGTVMESTNL